MKQKNGFTLIELLASVVVLVIILLIAIPTINRLTDETKRKSFENSAYGLIKAGDLYYSRREMMGEELVDKLFEFPNNISGLEFSGDIPEKGSMMISSDGDIVLAISNDKYCITKEYDSSDIIITKDVENCILPTMMYTNGIMTSTNNCINTGTCPNGTLVNVQVNDSQDYNFYVIKDTGAKVTLIMDSNLGGRVEWASKTDYNDDTNYGNNGNSNKGPVTALTYLNKQTANWDNITQIENYTYDNNLNGTTKKYGYQKLEVKNGEGKLISQDGAIVTKIEGICRARLITYEEVTALETANLGTMPTYLYTNLSSEGQMEGRFAYLTATSNPVYVSYVWKFSANGYMYGNAVGASRGGVRPVIELSK